MTCAVDNNAVDPLDRFLDDLVSARIGSTLNQYRDSDPALDRPGAAQIRVGNLAAYLRARPDPLLLLVGEAAGYAGCRFSGIPFTSERSLLPDRWTSLYPRGRVEHSASIVHPILQELGLEATTVLWNLCPTHPAGSTSLSNRAPTPAERQAGAVFLARLVSILVPALVVAVGVHAGNALQVTPIRHPANGGKAGFRLGLINAVASRR